MRNLVILWVVAASSWASGCSDSAPEGTVTPDADSSEDASTLDAGPASAPDAGGAPDGGTDPAVDDDAGPAPAPHAIGGGEAYARKVCREDATVIVDELADLVDSVEGAAAGDVVYVDETAEWDVTGMTGIDIPAGVTLAGGRGCDGSEGALLYTTVRKHGYIFDSDGDMVRFTGMRVRGAVHDRTTLFDPDGDHYSHNGLGVSLGGDLVEVDNNHIYGFTDRNLQVRGDDAHVHHNTLTRSLMDGLGYGVHVGRSARIEHNYFDYNRHAIASGGRASYEAAYNVVGPNMMPSHHFFDMHAEGGTTLRFHHNTFESAVDAAIVIRGTPSDGAWIDNNWFLHATEPDCDGGDGEAWRIDGGCDNVHVGDNHFGEAPPESCEMGAPRDGCPAP